MKCENCGQTIEDGCGFCVNCGHQSPAPGNVSRDTITCPDCGRVQAKANSTCDLCGHLFKATDAYAGTQSAPAFSNKRESKPVSKQAMPVYLIPLAAVIFIVSLGAYYALRENYGVGEHIKPFTLQSISAEDYTVTGKNDQGAITALLFFTNRCPYCHMEAGEISKAYASLNIQPILIGIREPAGTAAYFAEKHGVPEEVPVLIDSDGSIFSQFDGKGVPFNVLLKDGVVVDKWSGFAPGHLAKQARAAGAENLPR